MHIGRRPSSVEDAGLEIGTEGGGQQNPLDWISCSPLSPAPALDLSFTVTPVTPVHFRKAYASKHRAVYGNASFGKSVTNEQSFGKNQVIFKVSQCWKCSSLDGPVVFRSCFLL